MVSLGPDDERQVRVRRPRVPGWSDRPDPVAVAVGLAALLVYALQGFGFELRRDLAVYAYAGQQVVEGVPPYVGVLNRAGPLAHVLPGVGVLAGRLTGVDDLLAMRVWFMLLSVACVVVVYVVARNAFAAKAAGLVSAAALLSFDGFRVLAATGPREKTPMLLFVVLALWALTRGRWLASGVFVGLATLCLQLALLPGLAAVVAWVLMGPRSSWLGALLRVAAGGAVTVAVTVASFLAMGALRELVDGFVLLNARYTLGTPVVGRLDRVWATLVDGFGLSLWVLVGGLAALVVLAAGPVWRPGVRGTPGSSLVVACLAGAGGALLWLLRDYDNWPDAFLLLPFSALGAGSVVWVLARRLSRRTVLAVAGVVSAVLAVGALTASLQGNTERLQAQRRSVEAVLGVLPDDATVVSLEAPQPLVLGGRRNPSRYQMFAGGLDGYLDDTWPGGIEGFARSILDSDAELVAVGNRMQPTWGPRLAAEYELVGRAPGWAWFARTSLGEDVLAALRQAAKRPDGPQP